MMASQSKVLEPAGPSKNPFMFKGYPQPPVDERLKQARNFLADEDVNRCLDFTSKLTEIEEFLLHIEKEKLPCNKYLFGDVKVMAEVQKDWTKRMDKPPVDYDGPNVPLIPSYSTRLINRETAAYFQLQREAYGVVTQMRDDHPPFTIERSNDQVDFLNKMTQAACTDPDKVDPVTNLHYVEHRAYDWALREPSLIPYWMHWRRGLPTEGIKAADPRPWYRENARMRKGPSTPAPRPHNVLPREALPDYLQRREDEINRLLRSHQPGTVSSNLADLLFYHAPAAFQELRHEYDYLSSIQDLLSVEERLTFTAVTTKLDNKLNEWVAALRPGGVQIRLSHATWMDANTPGIFYVAEWKPIYADHLSLRFRENGINSLLASSDTSAEAQEQLRTGLEDFTPAEIQRCDDRAQAILIKAGKKTYATFSKMSQTQREEFNKLQLEGLQRKLQQSYLNAKAQRSNMYNSWVGALRATKVTLVCSHPGEICPPSLSQLYCPGHPEVERLLQLPPPHVRQLESDINDCLYMIETTGKKKSLNARLDHFLDSVTFPRLQEMDPAAKVSKKGASKKNSPPNSRSSPPSSHGSDDATSLAIAGKLHTTAYRLWKDCLISRKIEIRMQEPNREIYYNPRILYYRGINDGLKHPAPEDDDYGRWADQINDERRGQDHKAISSNKNLNTFEKEMYDLLAHLQYPFLKRMDIAWRTVDAMPSPDVHIVQKLRASWLCAFKAWLAMLLNQSCRLIIVDAAEDNETRGDPGVVYYRGPISELDCQSEDENQDELPEDIQKQVNEINVLMREYTTNQTKQAKGRLETLFRDFWRPVRDHEDHQDLLRNQSLTFDEIERLRGREEEYNRRLLLFIKELTRIGFKLKKHRSGSYEVEDSTAKLTEQWRILGDHGILDHNPQYFQKLLSHLWVYPKRFYRTLRDAEVEINDCLQILNPNHPPIDEDGVRLFRLMRPFLPHALAELARHLESISSDSNLMTHAVEPQHVPIQKSFVAFYAQWLRQLQRYARTKWIKILVWDTIELSTGSFAGLEGRLYFPRPSTSITPVHQDNHESGPLPVRFMRYQKQINHLLQRRRLQREFPDRPFTFKENDRLRQLLHLVMNPVNAKADNELRDIDEKSRVDILQGEELTSYLSKLEIWQTKYNQWVDSFPDGGIELQALNENTPRNNVKPGVRYIHIGNDQLLPPSPRSCTLPLHVQRMTREFKITLRAKSLTNLEQKAVFDWYRPLVMSSYSEDIHALRKYFFREQFPERVNPNNRTPLSSEMAAIVKCVEDLAFKTVWERLKRIAITERRIGTSIQIYEPVRGELRIRVITRDERGTFKMKRQMLKVSDITMIPGIDEAKLEYLSIAEKVRDGLDLTESERAEIARHFKPPTDRDHGAETEEAIVLLLKVSKGNKLPNQDEVQAKDLILRSLWRHFAQISPDLVERACPGLKYATSIESLLDLTRSQATGQPIPLYPAPTEAEVREVGAEINNILQKFRDGTIIDEENQILDHLLRPLVNDRLRELNRQMQKLTLITTSTDHSPMMAYQSRDLNSRQSLYLLELQTQWAVEFEKWKTNLPRYGVIIDQWYSEPDVVPDVMSRYRTLKDALSNLGGYDPEDQDSLEVFLVLKRYITDSTFSDDNGKLMLQRLPADITSLRDVLFDRRKIVDAGNRRPSLSERLSLNLLEHEFVSRYMAWYNEVPLRQKIASQQATITDFSGKAERRGVQRAAIELALNLLATNEEQRRPLDKFRRVLLPPSYRAPPKEVQLCLPLEPCKRPVEQEPFKITKMLLKYRKWRDHVFSVARTRAIDTLPSCLEPPINYNGPCTLASEHELWVGVKKRASQLVQIQAALIHTGGTAPRPLIHRLTTIINEALVSLSDVLYVPAEDDSQEKLESGDLEILRSLCAPSWNEICRSYPEFILGVDDSTDYNRARLNEFERDVNLVMEELPLWQPSKASVPRSTDPNNPEFYVQQLYKGHQESITGWEVATLIEDKINNNRKKRAKNLHSVEMWSRSEAIVYLKAMHVARRIHFQSAPKQELISRIPHSGHPENKYIVSPDQVHKSYNHCIRLKKGGKWEVQYDSAGKTGQPILQPNLYEYLQKIAYKVGRDIRELHKRIGGSHTEAKILEEQFGALKLTHDFMDSVIYGKSETRFQSQTTDQSWIAKEISLGKIARDLHQVAPDLATEAMVYMDSYTIGDRAPTIIVQMQLIQESNNNWDSRFPENEHVWDFAASRLTPEASPEPLSTTNRPTQRRINQYFNVRRWPVWAQDKKTQAAVKSSGFVVQEKPAPPAPISQIPEEVESEVMEKVNRERYTGYGGIAMFPFGETPYQRAYLSWKMEQDLADVEEFNPKPPRRRFFSGKRKAVEEPPVDRYALPPIPDNWQPDSVSWKEKHYDVTERARDTDGFSQNLAYYYTQEEMDSIEFHEDSLKHTKLQNEAQAMVEAREGRPYADLTRAEILAAQHALGIDPYSGIVPQNPELISSSRDTQGTTQKQPPRASQPRRTQDSTKKQAPKAASSKGTQNNTKKQAPKASSGGTQDGTKKKAPRTSSRGIPIQSKSSSKRKADEGPTEQAAPNTKKPRQAKVEDCEGDDNYTGANNYVGGDLFGPELNRL